VNVALLTCSKCEGKTFQGHDTPLFNDSLVETEQPVCPSTSSSNGERYGFVPALNWDGMSDVCILTAYLSVIYLFMFLVYLSIYFYSFLCSNLLI
jgi:hypothetical protein